MRPPGLDDQRGSVEPRGSEWHHRLGDEVGAAERPVREGREWLLAH